VSIDAGRRRRRAGLLLPLFSCPSRASWGIGEFTDVPVVAAWMRRAGFSVLQVLPLNELLPGQHSPYSAVSSMALDPIFISLPHVPEFIANGGEAGLEAAERTALDDVRSRRHVALDAVREIKTAALRRAFDRFAREEYPRGTPRARDFERFVDEQRWWLDDYALFRAIHDAHGLRSWLDWPAALRGRSPGALAEARRAHEADRRYRQYLQWIAHRQWQAARAEAEGVAVFGDFPFAVAVDSADTWAHQDLFAFDGTIGAPPDAFSEDGQNWKLPVYRWEVLAARSYDWFARRARRAAALFDGYRIDHVVGLFRMWVFPTDGSAPHFRPEAEGDQVTQGRAVLRAIAAMGGEIVAEDLGTVPDFVRAELRNLGMPGFKVLRWERVWDAPGRPFLDPAAYAPVAVATTGTHDTDTLMEWWDASPLADRQALLEVPSIRRRVGDISPGSVPFAAVHQAILDAMYGSGADLLVLPVQDVFGWPDRINVPGIVDDHNWTWKLPWPVDDMARQPEAIAGAAAARALAACYDRLPTTTT